jgi:uncharacterized small protein (DUF1192 family)
MIRPGVNLDDSSSSAVGSEEEESFLSSVSSTRSGTSRRDECIDDFLRRQNQDPRALHTVALQSARELFFAELHRFTERTAVDPAFRGRKNILLTQNHDLVEKRTLSRLTVDQLNERIRTRREEVTALDAEIEALEGKIRAVKDASE